MNTETLLAEEIKALDIVLKGVVGLDERYISDFRKIMFQKSLDKKGFLITEGKICNLSE